MGKKPVLAMVGAVWAGLAMNGCESCQTRAHGRKFQPAPLVQTRQNTNSNVAATGFQTPPKSSSTPAATTTPVDGTQPATPVSASTPVSAAPPAPLDTTTSGKTAPVQQTSATLTPPDSLPTGSLGPPSGATLIPPPATGNAKKTDDTPALNTTKKALVDDASLRDAPPPLPSLPRSMSTLPPVPTAPRPPAAVPPRSNVPAETSLEAPPPVKLPLAPLPDPK